MDKKKVLTALSILGLSGGLMFSVSALSADTVTESSSPSLSTIPGNVSPMDVDCDTNPGNVPECRAS